MGKFELPDQIEKDLAWLRKYLVGETDFMPPNLKKKWHLLNFIDDQLRDFATADEIIASIEVKYGKRISKATGYRYIQQAKRVFKTIDISEKDYDKRILNEMLLASIKKAFDSKDYVAVDRMYRTYWKANDLGKLDAIDQRERPAAYQLIINNNQSYDLLNMNLLNDPARNNLINEIRKQMLPPALEDLLNAGKTNKAEPSASGSDNKPEEE